LKIFHGDNYIITRINVLYT